MDRSWSRNLVIFVTVVLTVTSPCRGQPRESTHPSVAPQTKEAQEPLSETCHALLDRSWRDQERYVWTRLCDGKPADLDDLYGKTQENDWIAIVSDKRRHLRAEFVNTILGNPAFQAVLKNSRIYLSDALIDHFNISGLASRSLVLTNVVIAQGLGLHDCTFEDGIEFDYLIVRGQIDVSNLVARKFVQRYSQVDSDKSLNVTDSKFETFLLERDNERKASIFNSRISEIDISNLGKTIITIWKMIGDEIDIKYSEPIKVSLSEITLTRSVRLIGVGWDNEMTGGADKDPPLVLSYISGQELSVLAPLPDRLGIGHAGFQSVNFGPDPLPALPHIEPVGDSVGSTYIPFLAAMARFYATIGRADIARELTYTSNLRTAPPPEQHVDYAIWLVRLVSVGFGQRVHWGILWIMGLVLLGWGVFYLGKNRLADPNNRPANWLLFSLDTVIPVINLDKTHEEIAFRGWPQWYLYFLRLMGAVLAFLVFFFLKQAILGSE